MRYAIYYAPERDTRLWQFGCRVLGRDPETTERVAQIVGEHLEGRRDHGNRIWLLLTAEVWYRHFIGRRSAEDLEAELVEAGGGAVPRRAVASPR